MLCTKFCLGICSKWPFSIIHYLYCFETFTVAVWKIRNSYCYKRYHKPYGSSIVIEKYGCFLSTNSTISTNCCIIESFKARQDLYINNLYDVYVFKIFVLFLQSAEDTKKKPPPKHIQTQIHFKRSTQLQSLNHLYIVGRCLFSLYWPSKSIELTTCII